MSARNVTARFRLDRPDFSLDVDLQLPGQGVTALFGQSGSGKTTLLRCMAGLERATGEFRLGETLWQDERTFVPVHRRPLAYVFQEASLFAHLNVRKNLQFGQQRVPENLRRVSLEQAIELLGIGHLLERMPAHLSGGEKQRVAIARALAVSPQLLLMDEPLSALDFARKQEILPYLERLHDELDIPVVYVSHSPDEVARLADHLVVLEGGRATAQGPIGEVLAQLDTPIRLGEDAGVVVEASVAERDSNWHLARVEFAGGQQLWVRDGGQALGQRVRLRIPASDVSLTLEPQCGTSILNALPARIVEMAEDTHPALALVRLQVGTASILARLTKRSAAALHLHPGQSVWAQVKAVALVG